MTITRNYRELSRKKKIFGLTPKAWFIYSIPCIFTLAFEMLGLFFGSLFLVYLILFVSERFDEDIFEIFYKRLQSKLPKRVHC